MEDLIKRLKCLEKERIAEKGGEGEIRHKQVETIEYIHTLHKSLTP